MAPRDLEVSTGQHVRVSTRGRADKGGAGSLLANANMEDALSEIEIHKCACANCGWQGDVDEAKEVRNFWSRVQPGDTMPAGECPECECLVYPVEATPAPRPVRVYLNLSGGDRAPDHLIAVQIDLPRLEGLARLVAMQDLDSVAIRPPYALFSYDGCVQEPADGFVATEAASEFEDHHLEDRVPGAEPTLRLDGFILRIASDGYCYGEAGAQHHDGSFQTEALSLADVARHLAGDQAPAEVA